MSRRRSPALYVTVDASRRLALVCGRQAERVVRLLVPVDEQLGYSLSGRGWIIPEDRVQDVDAYCQYYGELVVVHRRKIGQEAAP